jgi:hypothetical protein
LSYFLNFLCRVIFNTFSKVRLPMDLWMLFDIMAGVVNIGAFMIIGNATPASIYNENEKRFYDYYIIVVLIISWIRFFSYFLVVDTIGKITITLLRMIQETAYFLFIVISYFLLMATIFTTLFRNSDSTDPTAPDFSDFFDTLRDLFNYTTATTQTHTASSTSCTPSSQTSSCSTTWWPYCRLLRTSCSRMETSTPSSTSMSSSQNTCRPWRKRMAMMS